MEEAPHERLAVGARLGLKLVLHTEADALAHLALGLLLIELMWWWWWGGGLNRKEVGVGDGGADAKEGGGGARLL